MSERPNILWICTDSQRWDTLGCYGNPFVRSPNIDRLASQGVRFEGAYAQNPLCMPSRGSFLTGRYPSTNRLRQNGQTVPPDLKPVTRTLRDAGGYVCGLAGKLHLSACDRRLTFGPEWWKVPPEQWRVPFEQRVDDGYAVFHWAHGHDSQPHSAYNEWLRARGHGGAPDSGEGERLGPFVSTGLPADQTHAAFCVDKAVEFVELHAAKKSVHPWLFSVNIVEPHPNFAPPREFLEPYLARLDEIPLPAWVEGELDGKPAHQRDSYAAGKPNVTKGLAPRELRLVRAAYWALCDMIDAQVGLLLDALERTGQRENTLVIFTSDHGELLGDHGRTWKGPYLYDSSIHVPLIVAMPGVIPAGRRARGLVELTDLAPTILEGAGLPRDPSMQGHSLWSMLKGDAPLDRFRDDVYCEYHNANPDRPPQWLSMVRTVDWKLIAVHNTGEGELYDLRADPWEHHNLWLDPAAKDVKIDMLQRLCARMAFTADPLPARIGVF